MIRMTTFGVLILVASGCATVTSYQKPITDFGTAVANAETALEVLDQTATAELEAQTKAEIEKNERLVLPKDKDCLLQSSSRCRLMASNEKGSIQYPPDHIIENMITLMQGITAYSQGLTAIVSTDSAEQVAASVNSALGGAASLANSIDDISKSESKSLSRTIKAYKTPTGKALKWLTGQYIAKMQLNGLEQAVTQANPVIKKSMVLFSGAAAEAEKILLNRQLTRYNEARKNYRSARRGDDNEEKSKALQSLVEAAAAYDRLLTSRASSVFGSMGTAHQALFDSFTDDDKSVLEVIAAIEEFSNQAAAVVEIVREFQDVEVED